MSREPIVSAVAGEGPPACHCYALVGGGMCGACVRRYLVPDVLPPRELERRGTHVDCVVLGGSERPGAP